MKRIAVDWQISSTLWVVKLAGRSVLAHPCLVIVAADGLPWPHGQPAAVQLDLVVWRVVKPAALAKLAVACLGVEVTDWLPWPAGEQGCHALLAPGAALAIWVAAVHALRVRPTRLCWWRMRLRRVPVLKLQRVRAAPAGSACVGQRAPAASQARGFQGDACHDACNQRGCHAERSKH